MKKQFSSFHIFFAFVLLVAFASCKKDYDRGMDEMKDKAKILFINAAPNVSTDAAFAQREIGIYPVYNNVAFETFPIKFPWTNGYKAFDPGTMNMKFDSAFSPSTLPPGNRATLMQFSFPVQADNYYSVFAVGSVESAANIDTFVIRDDVSFPTKGKARITFYNLSKDAGAVDVVNTATGATVIANLAYKQRGATMEIDPVSAFNIRVNAAGTTTQLTSRNNLVIDPNSVYTVYIRGSRLSTTARSDNRMGINYHANRWTY